MSKHTLRRHPRQAKSRALPMPDLFDWALQVEIRSSASVRAFPSQDRAPKLLPIWSDDRRHLQGWEVAR